MEEDDVKRYGNTERILISSQEEMQKAVTSVDRENRRILDRAPGLIQGEVKKERRDRATKYGTIVDQKLRGWERKENALGSALLNWRKSMGGVRNLGKNNGAPLD